MNPSKRFCGLQGATRIFAIYFASAYYPAMTPDQVIKHFGGEQAAAEALECTRQIVNYWRNQGHIPLKTQAFIQVKTNGKLRADLNGSKQAQ